MSDQKIEELRQLVRTAGPALLINLVQLMPEAMLDQALSVADGIEDTTLRARALRVVAERLPEDQRTRILNDLPAAGSVLKDAPPGSLDQLRRILSDCSEAEQESLIKMTLDEIGRLSRQKKSAKPTRTLGGGVVRKMGGSKKGGGKRSSSPKLGPTRGSSIRVPKTWPSTQSGGDSAPSLDDIDNYIPARGAEKPYLMPVEDVFTIKGRGTVADSSSSKTSARQDIVNLGFSKRESPDKTEVKETLRCGETYLFWLEVGAMRPDSMSIEQVPLRVEELPREEKLEVALFSFKDELEITKGEDIGELQITRDMTVEVAKQPMSLRRRPASGRLKTCLFFPVRVPDRAGVYRLRCNIYCKQTLIESWLISVVAQQGAPQKVDAAFFDKEKALFSDDSPHTQHEVALYADADFILSQALTPALLPQTPHRLSLMLNSNGNGTHSFRFFGKQGTEHLKDDATLEEGELKSFVKMGREALRQASWGSTEEWDNVSKYLYEDSSFVPERDMGKLAKELVRLAIPGYQFYSEIKRQLTNDPQTLRRLMAEPGLVQVALKKSSRHIFPAALIYDYPYDTLEEDIRTSTFELCKSFDAAMRSSAPLEEADCFKGKCWLRAEHAKNAIDYVGDFSRYVCPSGFWGYRHALGFPRTLGKADDVPEQMILRDSLEVVYGYSTDFDPEEHVEKLQGVRQPIGWHHANNRRGILKLLVEKKPHLVYFYCHGGISATGVPFMEVGERDMLDPSNFSAAFSETYWEDPRPLVFLNGCHTTAMSPEVAVKFVEAFVQDARASGVIGTEITIFEPLARAFAEDCLRRFLGGEPFTEPVPLGWAVRGARLALLKQGNPLGLVYIPFASASLRLVKQ